MNGSSLPEYEIRNLRSDEYPLLEEFLYEAIFVPADFVGEVPRSIIYDDPMCRAAFEEFGSREDDIASLRRLATTPSEHAGSARPTSMGISTIAPLPSPFRFTNLIEETGSARR